MTRGPNVPRETDASKDPSPVTVLLVGNTVTRMATFQGNELVADARTPTGTPLGDLGAGPIVVISVVPAATPDLPGAIRMGRDTVGLEVACQGIGADRLANALALFRGYGPGVAVDCGTATTFTVVDADGVVRGGAIMPGLGTSRDVLAKATAQLPAIDLGGGLPRWGDTTETAIRVGLVDGHVGAIAHLLRNAPGHVVVTGGWSELLSPLLPIPHVRDVDLTIRGGSYLG